MPLKLTQLELPIGQPEETLRDTIARRLRLSPAEIVQWRILRKSLDARSRDRLRFIYSAEVQLTEEDARRERLCRRPGVEPYRPVHFDHPTAGQLPLDERPIIVGSGPAGLLAAYYLAQRGYRPLVLERGDPVKARVPAIRAFDRGGPLDCENNYLFGEGGAGTFSDGKLTCRMSGADVEWVLEQFVACGGKPEIRYDYRPHLGSNRLPMIVRNFRRRVEAWGGEYRFRCRVEGLEFQDGQLRGVRTSSGWIPSQLVVLAIGHSARDTYEMLHRVGVPMQAKAFQLGLRIEQPQERVNRYKYGPTHYEDRLGAADYTLIGRGPRNLFTFCMCAGGYIIPSVSEPGMFCTNGMSNSRHDTPFANSGLVATLEPEEFGSDHPLAGVELQRRYEAAAFRLGRGEYLCPIQDAEGFLSRRTPPPLSPACSYQRGGVAAVLDELLPPAILTAVRDGLPEMDRQWRGQFLREAVLVGPEMRGSSPVRMPRDQGTRQSPRIAGLYPVGEGAGFAGGIVSAAVDGLRTAKAIVARYAPTGEVPAPPRG